MKKLKVLFSLIIVVTILFASTLSVRGIGFTAEKIYESVFVVYSGNALGSGFALGKNCIITNAHVISNVNSVIVRTYGGEQYNAYVVGMDEKQDIAILGVADAEFPFLTVADYTTMNTGDDVYAIGAPKSMAYTLTKGVISAKERQIGIYSYIQIDAAINEGNSGGPLLNDLGQVIGMNTFKMSDSEGIGLAIHIDNICDYLRTLNIELDNTGNVSGNISIYNNNEKETEESSEETLEDENERAELDESNFHTITTFAFCIAAISIAINIILAIMLVKQKRNNLKNDPRERTDFEIDILE